MRELLYLDDLEPGQVFHGGHEPVDAEAIKRFAREFDPQPFHLDEAAAEGTFFKGLAASGWHTVALTMRMQLDAFPVAGGIVGAGVDELRWMRPVRPGDVLSVEMEVLDVKRSASRPEQGRVRMRSTTKAQDGEAVQTLVANLIVPRRPRVEAAAAS